MGWLGAEMTEVGATLRAARETAGLSLSQVAKRTHYGKSYLGLVETGIRRVTPEVVLAYEKALGMPTVGLTVCDSMQP